MSKTPNVHDLNKISTEDLEAMLTARKKEDEDAKSRKRAEYEAHREALINNLGETAAELRSMLGIFKLESMQELVDFRGMLLEYGDLRGGAKNKGSFELKNDRFKIIFKTQVRKRFDERALVAEEKLKQFLATFVRKNDKTYKLIMSLLERDATTGEFDIDLINRLYKMEKEFDNPLWVEALTLFKESYSPTGTAQYIAFQQKLEDGTWQSIVLDFAKLPSNTDCEEESDDQE